VRGQKTRRNLKKVGGGKWGWHRERNWRSSDEMFEGDQNDFLNCSDPFILLRAVACNVAATKSYASRGAIAYLMRLSGDRAKVLVRSRGGRWIQRWTKIAGLANFRFKTVPVGHSLQDQIGQAMSAKYLTEADLAALAARGAGQNRSLR
jgi:hypothetical protein